MENITKMGREEAAPPLSVYAWFDAEFSSLELESARLLQVALLLTDAKLRPLLPPEEDALNLFIRLEDGVEPSPWVVENLSGLLDRCRSKEAVSVEEADRSLAALLDELVPNPDGKMEVRPILAGNSVHNDWMLARRFLPVFLSRLHYRLLDVSTLKTLWKDAGEKPFEKDSEEMLKAFWPGSFDGMRPHDALFDIKASIAELAFYRSRMFPPAR